MPILERSQPTAPFAPRRWSPLLRLRWLMFSATSRGALRAGAGLVTAAVPESILASVAAITPELMTLPLKEGAAGEIDKSNLEPDQLRTLTERATVLAMGPG